MKYAQALITVGLVFFLSGCETVSQYLQKTEEAIAKYTSESKNPHIDNQSIPFEQLPKDILNFLASEYVSPCISDEDSNGPSGWHMTFENKFIKKVDFNQDGLADYIIRSPYVTCNGMYGYEGSGGGNVDIFFQEKNGHFIQALDFMPSMDITMGRHGPMLSYDKHYIRWDKKHHYFIAYNPHKGRKIIQLGGDDYFDDKTP